MIETINWVKDGPYRLLILQLLKEKPMLSGEIAKKLGIHHASASRTLRALENKGLVVSIRGRTRTVTYKITELGLRVLKEVSQ